MDLDPFVPVGITASTMRLLDVFLLHCLLSDSPPDTPAEIAELRANQLLAAERGRESGLRLQRQGREVPLAEWGGQILAECEPLAAALDATHQCGDYSAALRDAQALLGRPADTPSARVLDKIETAHGHSFSAFSLSQSLAGKRPALPHWTLWVRMARPGFLVVTAIGCVLGMASAQAAGAFTSAALACVTVVLALMLHAAANMLNDHADAINGADAANTQGLYPFTGGSRMVQTGQVDAQDMHRVAWVLLTLVAVAGVWLAARTGWALLGLGLAGMALGWVYSMPPLALMARGLGEVAVGLAWGLVVVGADYVQRGQFSWQAAAVAAGFAALVANILIGNGFPDAPSDAAVGKRTMVVRLGTQRAAMVYLGLALWAHGALAAWVALHVLAPTALWGLASLPLSLVAVALLWRHHAQPQWLRLALVLGIAAASVHGLALAAGLCATQ
jgi:1,4-dihydroxy-2-naphthoate octaprenyltransferase